MDQHELDGLIQDVLDGVASPEQVARLEARLRQDPATRERHGELTQIFAALRASRRLEAPPELKMRILRSLPPGAPGVRTGAPQATATRRFRLAYVLALGLAAAIIGAGALAGYWKSPAPGGPSATGSMMPSSSPGATVTRWQVGAARVEARAWRAQGARLVAFRVTGAPAQIELSFDPTALTGAAIRSAPPAEPATFEPGKVTFRGAEQTETVVELREPSGGATPLRVTIRAGNLTSEGLLAAPPAP